MAQIINEVRVKDSFAIGDTVLWRGNFNQAPPVRAVISGIEISTQKRSKYGEETESALWSQKEFCVVNLSNGHWAYGEQIFPCYSQEPDKETEMVRINRMVKSWQETGRAHSRLTNDDKLFFACLGLNPLMVGITSVCGGDLLYYNTAMYASDTDAIKERKI